MSFLRLSWEQEQLGINIMKDGVEPRGADLGELIRTRGVADTGGRGQVCHDRANMAGAKGSVFGSGKEWLRRGVLVGASRLGGPGRKCQNLENTMGIERELQELRLRLGGCGQGQGRMTGDLFAWRRRNLAEPQVGKPWQFISRSFLRLLFSCPIPLPYSFLPYPPPNTRRCISRYPAGCALAL